jgi:RNA polymerase sigma-70 factor (ECF subfamily)
MPMICRIITCDARVDLSTYEDRELLRLLALGRESALREFYHRYWDSLFTKAFNFLRFEDAAKDWVQEVFVWPWTHRAGLQVENTNSYLHQATRFQALKSLREEKAADDFEKRLSQLTDYILASDTLEFKELKTWLEGLISAIPEDQRNIFRLHREESLTYSQIAEKLGISVKTVEKKMSLSLRCLREHTNEQMLLLLFFLPVAAG